jgi:hypothetical protein
MVMDPGTPPILGLIMEDFTLFIERFIGGSPKNTIRVRIFWGKVFRHMAIVALECHSVVIPVHGHGERIPDEYPI